MFEFLDRFKKNHAPEVTVAKIEEIYVAPTKQTSRLCTQEDVKQILKDAQLMYDLCFAPVGIYKSAYAVCHVQINNTDPLAFFVTKEQKIIINPKIVRHTKTAIEKEEGCMTFSRMAPKMVKRYHKCEVEFQTIDESDNLTEPAIWPIKGIEAQVVQHELDHINGKNIYGIYN